MHLKKSESIEMMFKPNPMYFDGNQVNSGGESSGGVTLEHK